MSLSIRLATLNDSQAIADLINLVFKEEVPSAALVPILQKGEHTTYLAFLAEQLVGFIDGFRTTSKKGLIRVELDLLAVHPDYRGQGIAKQLIQTFTAAQTDYDLIRALVAVANSPMHHTMQRTGYKLQKEICGLYARDYQQATLSRATSHTAHLIPVETFTYRGIWLEGRMSINAMIAAFNQSQIGDIIGLVAPLNKYQKLETFIRAFRMQHIGDYQWWHFSKKKG